MTIAINILNIKPLQNETMFEYSTQYVNWVEENLEIKAKILPMFNDLLVPAYKKLDLGIKNIRGSEHTIALVGFDKRRDNAWLNICDLVKVNSRHPEKEYTDSAHRLELVAKTYKGLERKAYDKQTGSIRNVLQELRGEYKKDIEKLGIIFWVDELENANNEFAKIMDSRFNQTAAKATVDVKAVRSELGDIFKVINNYLNGLVLIEGAAKYDAAFRKINTIIARYGGEKKKYESVTNGDNVDNTSDIPLWTADIDYTKMKIGDKYKTSDGRIWEAIDLGQVHRDPAGEFGHFGWKEVVNTESEDEVTYCEEG